MFDFIDESITSFDAIAQNFENFHIQFLMQLSRYLGILPDSGKNLLKEIGHSKAYDQKFIDKIDFLLQSKYDQHLKLSKSVRNDILKSIIDFYRYHYDSIREIKSLQVLREVMS
jgi:DNA repair protein RecO (recombination protein O)